jgi:hypothetical protein
MPQLLCEGACNGVRIPAINAAILKWRQAVDLIPWRTRDQHLPKGYRLASIDEFLYKGCVYTPHRQVVERQYVCLTCGHERQWGLEE